MMDPVLNLREQQKGVDDSRIPMRVVKDASADGSATSLRWDISRVYTQYDKKRLFIVAGFIALCGVALMVGIGEYLFGLFLMLAGAVIVIFHMKAMPMKYVVIDRLGIEVNHERHGYRDLKSFWILYEPGGVQQLIIEPRRWHMPVMHIPIDGLKPLAIRDILIQYLPERPHHVSLVDIILRKLKL